VKNIFLIAGRELRAFVRSPLGCIAAAAVLLIDGMWFMTQGLGKGAKLSAQVLFQFFYPATGTTAVVAIVLSMRLIALEREKNTLVLINTSPVREIELVLGKFLALFGFLVAVNVLSVYMPVLVYVNGRISPGHIVVGYAGILLLGAAVAAIGVFASSLARTQVIAVIVAAVLTGVLYLVYLVAQVTDPPLNTFANGLALHHERQKGFMNGVLQLENVVFYLAVTYFFLLAAIKTLEARRWR
jgi:ABC-2 type transport system permease protein